MFATLAMPSRRQPQPAGRYLWFRRRLIPTQPGQAMAAPLSQGKKMVTRGPRGRCAPHHFQNVFDNDFLLSIFQFRGQQLEQALVDIILLPYILICLAEQLRVGQAIDTCVHTVTYETFAPCSQLIHLLPSRNSTISTHVPRRVHSKSTRMSLHAHEPWGA